MYFLQNPASLIPGGIALVLIVFGARLAEKSGFLRGHAVRTGIWFGLLAVIAARFAVNTVADGIPLSLHDGAIVVAGFFFGPAAAVTAGICAVAGQLVLPFFLPSAVFGRANAAAVLLLTGFVAFFARYVFDRERPPVLTAGLAAGIIGLTRIALAYFLGEMTPEKALESSYDIRYFLPPAIGLTAMAAGFLFAPCRNWRRNFLSPLAGILLFFCVSHILIIVSAIYSADDQMKSGMKEAVRVLDAAIYDQIDFSLHQTALTARGRIRELCRDGQYLLSVEEMRQLADYCDVDELNLFTFSGGDVIVHASSDPAVIAYNRKPKPAGPLLPYRELLTGRRDFVRQEFRPSRENPEQRMKYAGIPMPDRDAVLQLGCSRERLVKFFPELFFPLLENYAVGEKGFLLITDSDGKILVPVKGHPGAAGKTPAEIGMTPDWRKLAVNEVFSGQLFGVWGKCCRTGDIGEFRFYLFIPYSEYYFPAICNSIVAGGVLLLFCLLFRFTLLHIHKAQRKIDELRNADLAIASTIQNSELRHAPLETPAVRVQALMTPAREVGGDFYDYYPLDDGRVVITIADVSGKGVPAAIFMMRARSILKGSIFRSNSLKAAMEMANDRLNRRNDAFMFVTAWVGIFDPAAGVLEFVSAGHNPPLVKRRDGSVQWVRHTQRTKPLAAFAHTVYTGESLRLAAGDRLFLYTDGVTEAMNRKGGLFGEERLERVLAQTGGELIAAVGTAVEEFVLEVPKADDITMLVLTVK